jgi:hypothetical protein
MHRGRDYHGIGFQGGGSTGEFRLFDDVSSARLPSPLAGGRARSNRRLLLCIAEFPSIENAMPSDYHFGGS